jgi:release factor glutamine methyltransferase
MCNSYLQAIKNTASRLETAGIEGARTESELIFAELAGCSRIELFSLYNTPMPEAFALSLEKIIQRREKREPLQYILGHAYFMNLDLQVTPDVLVPRPETELLVERLCKAVPHGGKVLDLGTGSGAIALALAFERKDLNITAVDISEAALHVAESNRSKYKLDNVEFCQSDLFSSLGKRRFDCIAANLPYVSESEYLTLMPEVKDFEPKLALTAPADGLELIYKCIKKASVYLEPDGIIIFEMGITQARNIHDALKDTGKFKNIETIQDYSGRDRFVCARLI